MKSKKKQIREKRIQELELFVRQLREQVAKLQGDEPAESLAPSKEFSGMEYSAESYTDYLHNLANKTVREYKGPRNNTVEVAYAETAWDYGDKFEEEVATRRLKELGMEEQTPRPKGKGPMAFIRNMQKQTGLNDADFMEFTEQLQHQAADTPVEGPSRNPIFMRDDEWLKIAHDHTNGPHRNSHSHPLRNLLRIAIRWSANHEQIISPLQVAQDMIELKMARSQSHFKEDDWIDTMGYANLVQLMDDKLKEMGFLEGVVIFDGIHMSMLWMLLEKCRDEGVGS